MVLEIRTYALVPGKGPEFAALLGGPAGELLADFGIDVVRHGPSLDDPDRYVLLRAYADLETRTAQEDAFYSSDAWHTGPRAAVLAAIESYHEVVLDVSEAAVATLRG